MVMDAQVPVTVQKGIGDIITFYFFPRNNVSASVAAGEAVQVKKAILRSQVRR